VNATRCRVQLEHDGDADWCGQGPQQIACGVEHLTRRKLGGRAVVPVFLDIGGASRTGNRFHYDVQITCRIVHVNAVVNPGR
jgi:hypothetical protein